MVRARVKEHGRTVLFSCHQPGSELVLLAEIPGASLMGAYAEFRIRAQLDTVLGLERGEGPYREKPSMELKHLTPTHEPEREMSMNNARPPPRPNLGLAPLPRGEGETLPAS